MKLDTPILNGSDQWLREMRELEAEAYDPDAVPLARLPTLVTRESLEVTATLAREAFGTPDADSAPTHGLLPALHPKALLKWRG